MNMRNKEVAEALYEIGELLSLSGESVFRIRAYERAAQVIETLSEAIEDVAREDKLKDEPGIGESIAEKIKEYLDTGKIPYLEDLKKKFPQGLIEMMSVPGLGPKKAKLIFDNLKISDITELEKAAQGGQIRSLPGFGKKTEDSILKGINFKKTSAGRILLSEALPMAREIIAQLSKNKNVLRIDPAGSLRRYRETIGDIDILCAVDKDNWDSVIKDFTNLPEVERVLASGETKVSIVTKRGIQVDLRVIEPESYGAALQYFTGSKEHNVELRTLARRKGLTINEYGIFEIEKKEKPLAAKTEEEVYAAMGLAWIPPEMRENRGEIDAAAKNKIPKLLELKDIKGDVHVHSHYSDGHNSIEEMAEAAMRLGYEWIIITDHSQSLKIAHGLSVDTLRKKIKEIEKFNSAHKNFKVLCGVEIDILEHGNLDYPKSVLEDLDFVIASIHTGFKQPEEKITARIIRALENPFTNSIAHPTGRLLNARGPYAVNMEKVLKSARDNNKMLEINAFPERLDLNDINCRHAKEMGIKLAIGTDAHLVNHLSFMELGVAVARRAWLEKVDVINTMSYNELTSYLQKTKVKA